MNKERLWTGLAIIACMMWGISSLFATALFKLSPNINALWLSQIRQLTSGPILLIIAAIIDGHPFGIFKKDWHNLITLVCYGVFGMLPVQFCYFMAVQEGNASIATVLQFIGPFFIIGYVALFRHQRPLRIQIIAAIIAFLGVVLLATNGHLTKLAITPAVLFWGLLSAVGVATNTLIPQNLIKQGYSSLTITGWGIFFSGLALFCFHPAQPALPHTNLVWWYVAAVVVIGTLIPFQLATNSLKYISATNFSLTDAFEPVTATMGSVIFFNLHMTGMDWLGSALIVGAVIALNLPLPKFFRKEL